MRVDYDVALANLFDVPDDQQDNLLKAAADLKILDLSGNDVLFVHQLLQEYFAARHLAERINAASTPEELMELVGLAQVKWLEEDIKPSVQDELQALPKSGTLPDLPTTGWEETFMLAAAMVAVADNFLRVLADVNLPLAGRCAAQPGVVVSDNLREDLQQRLVKRSRDPATDLRARISAGNVLGLLGDPRFEPRQGALGRFLLPPMVAIDGGTYAIGSDEGLSDNEAPRHEVQLAPFSLGQFPVTNAEFKCFIDAGGYQDERWWDAPAAQRWKRWEGRDGRRKNWQYWRSRFKGEVGLLTKVAEEQAWTDEQSQVWRDYCAMTDEAFEAMLMELPPDQRFTQPEYWNNPTYNAPNQPVVGVCWFEAYAYSAWLSAQTGQPFRLPTEAEWEVATSGVSGRKYAWGESFDVTYCNAVDTELRRTTPVGVFQSGDTPPTIGEDGVADLSGNVWEWSSSGKAPYPYKADDEREDAGVEQARVLRGGSWTHNLSSARSLRRFSTHPDFRFSFFGFRVLCSSPIE